MNENVNEKRVEHHTLTTSPDIVAAENEFKSLMDDFKNKKKRKDGDVQLYDATFKVMDLVRERQEKLAKTHFDQDLKFFENANKNETENENEDNKREETKTRSIKDIDELVKQLEDLSTTIKKVFPNSEKVEK